MKYTSTEQIKIDFNIDLESIDEIRSELKSRIKTCHPDLVNPQDWENGLKHKFLDLTEAIEFIDTRKKENSSLVPVEHVTDLVKVLKDILPKTETITQETNFKNQLDSFYQERKDVMRIPKISLSVLTGLISFVWLFPQTVAEHPVLKNIISFDNNYFVYGWLATLFYAVIFWILISTNERREKNIIKSIKTERTQNRLFSDFIHLRDISFDKEELIEFILHKFGNQNKRISPFLLFGIGSGIDEETAESLANLLIQRAERNSIIEKDEIKKSFTDSYKIKNFA